MNDEETTTDKRCKVCLVVKSERSFSKVDRAGRRRPSCNACHRKQAEANKAGLTVEEYIGDFEANDVCFVCGDVDTVIYRHPHTHAPVGKVCRRHLMKLNPLRDFEALALLTEVTENFPFLVAYLRRNGKFLFSEDPFN